MVSLDEQLYKEKYLKYKKKYIQLKEYQGGDIKGMYKNLKNKAKEVAKEVKTNVNEKINLKAYIIAKTEVIQNLKNEIDNKTIKKNISAIEDFLKLKGYIIYSNDSKKIKLIGAKGTLSKLGDSANDLADYILGNKTVKGQIKEISNYIDKINNVINFITNNETAKKILNLVLDAVDATGATGATDATNNTVPSGATGGTTGAANNSCNTIKCYIDKIIESEKLNMDHVNKIKQIINNNDKVLLNRKVSTYSNNDEIDNDNNNRIFDATYNKNNIDNIKKLVYNELIKESSQINTDDLKKISHIYIEYTNVPKSNANITFYINKA